ncbi:2174_t:CDS:2 [Acaulospora morrowiae]|uniref:2174_t:CDS:1 n=1 Tax=Acaulospora morrowiae TaxID=94023 RepID=A0A9N8V669_9GLOM|nr:2174_t:CDS:2 [Acaulospora morrowiae]
MVIYYSVYNKPSDFAIERWNGRDFDSWINGNPTYFYEIPEVTINNAEFLSEELFGNLMKIDLMDNLKKINGYSAKLREFNKEVLIFASSTLSYFSKNHKEFVKEWKNDIDPKNNLVDLHLSFIDKSIEDCKNFDNRFREFYKFLDSGIKGLEECLQKIKDKADKTIYAQTLEKKKRVDEWHLKSSELLHLTNYKKVN